MDFSHLFLETTGFIRWVPLLEIYTAACPSSGGVYVITYNTNEQIPFTGKSCGGWFKGKDPTVSLDRLSAKWVEGAEVVYIGQSGNLKRRLRQFADFGSGKPRRHWGGRFIWQLENINALRVAWKETQGQEPRIVEKELISTFKGTYGKLPFANLKCN
jgi:hypothetical protein